MVRVFSSPHLWPAAEKLSPGAMRGAGVLLVAFLGGAAALTGTCENWYAHPRTCHRPSVGETQWLEALLTLALCPAQRSVPDALALNLYPVPACLSTPPLHTHACPPRAPPPVFCFVSSSALHVAGVRPLATSANARLRHLCCH